MLLCYFWRLKFLSELWLMIELWIYPPVEGIDIMLICPLLGETQEVPVIHFSGP